MRSCVINVMADGSSYSWPSLFASDQHHSWPWHSIEMLSHITCQGQPLIATKICFLVLILTPFLSVHGMGKSKIRQQLCELTGCVLSTSAPPCTNSLQHSVKPPLHATCKGVMPSCKFRVWWEARLHLHMRQATSVMEGMNTWFCTRVTSPQSHSAWDLWWGNITHTLHPLHLQITLSHSEASAFAPCAMTSPLVTIWQPFDVSPTS